MSYKIHSWNGFLPGNKPYPYLLIQPDDKLWRLMELQSSRVSVKISNTNSSYDNLVVYADVQTSKVVPNFRPNFYQQTELYTVVLDMPWQGYPPNNGVVEILDFVKYDPKEFEKKPTGDGGDDVSAIVDSIDLKYIVLSFLVLLLIVLARGN